MVGKRISLNLLYEKEIIFYVGPVFLNLHCCKALELYFSDNFPFEDFGSTIICVSPTSRELSS